MNAVAVFELRAWARAQLYAACVFYDPPDAVDDLQEDAEESGLVAGLGQDAVQRILANAFHGIRAANAPSWKAVAAMAWNDSGWEAAAHEYHDNAHQRVAA
jgi:hypothetical protein